MSQNALYNWAGRKGVDPFKRYKIVRRGRPRRPQRSTYKRKPGQFKAVRNVCGTQYMIPVAPPAEKELTCLNCLQAAKEAI